jgi:hypothetical protein
VRRYPRTLAELQTLVEADCAVPAEYTIPNRELPMFRPPLEPLPACVRGVLSDRAADVGLARAGHRYVLPSLATSVAWRCAGGYSRAEIWDELKRQIPEVFA